MSSKKRIVRQSKKRKAGSAKGRKQSATATAAHYRLPGPLVGSVDPEAIGALAETIDQILVTWVSGGKVPGDTGVHAGPDGGFTEGMILKAVRRHPEHEAEDIKKSHIRFALEWLRSKERIDSYRDEQGCAWYRLLLAPRPHEGHEDQRSGPLEQYVMLEQMAAIVNRCKRTLQNRKRRTKNPLPPPNLKGGGGKPDEWLWSEVRPWLEQEFKRNLPERFPLDRFRDAQAERS